MKKCLKALLSICALLWSKIYSYKASEKMGKLRDLMYSMWIKGNMGEVGEGSIFCYPVTLQGGGSRRIRIGKNTLIQAHCVLGNWVEYEDEKYDAEIIVGDNCSIGEYTQITAINKITIGDGLLTGRFVYIGDNNHGRISLDEANILPSKRKLWSKGQIVIGNNVWIGDKVTILGGVTIGDNVIIGAGAVVTHDINSNCVVTGIPAKQIKSIN